MRTFSPMHNRIRLPWWFLWISIGLIIIPSVLIYWLDIQGTEQFSNFPQIDAMMNRFAKHSPIMFILYISLIGPVLEEFSFRSWVTGKNWGYIVSFSGTLIFVFSSLWQNKMLLISGMLCVITMGFIYFLMRKEHKRNLILAIKEHNDPKPTDRQYIIWYVVLSSLVFGLAHGTEFKGFVGIFFGILQTGALGMIAAFIGLRFGFIFSIITHVFWNSLVIVVFGLLLGQCSAQKYEFVTPEYKVVVKPVSFFQDYCSSSVFCGEDCSKISKVNADGYWLTEFAYMLRPKQKDVFFTTLGGWQSMQKYHMTIEALKEQSIEKSTIFHELLKKLPLHTDTVWTYPYRMRVSDSVKFAHIIDPFGNNMTDLCHDLATLCNHPLFCDDELDEVSMDFDYSKEIIRSILLTKNFQQENSLAPYGLEIITDSSAKIPWVIIKPE